MRKLYLLIIGLILFAGCDYNYLDISKTYSVGDRGPAGGWIFYVNSNWQTDGWKYLEAAPYDQSHDAPWRENASTINGTLDGLGKGYGDVNTKKILGVAGYGNSCAAKICDDLVLGGYDNWYLPTPQELKQMHLNLYTKGLGNFVNLVGDQRYYWSSRQYYTVATEALNYQMDFNMLPDGNNIIGNTSPQTQPTFRTRAVRCF
jgi:hypothetical protein